MERKRKDGLKFLIRMTRNVYYCTTLNTRSFHVQYLEPLRPILSTLEKFRPIFLKIKRRGPPVQDMPRHKLEAIKLLSIATEPVETVM